MIDLPLQLLVWIMAAVVFKRRGDRLWPALGKGFLVCLGVTVVLSLVLWISS